MGAPSSPSSNFPASGADEAVRGLAPKRSEQQSEQQAEQQAQQQVERQAKRRREILGATLRGVRRFGPAVSTAQIAALAKCSKETLYGWFGDRDGLMRALVEEQASAMAALLAAHPPMLGDGFAKQLRQQSVLLLDMMTGDAHLAVHQLAIAEDGTKSARVLGQTVMAQWEAQVVARFVALLNAGAREGSIVVYSPREAFDDLVGLLIGDRQRQLLMGQDARPAPAQMKAVAEKAVQRWMVLYGR